MYRTTRSPMMQPLVNSGMGMAPFFKVTVFEQEHFQGKCLEFTSECCNIQDCGLDNIRSIRVESGAWVGFEHHDFQGQQFILERGEYPHWDAYSGSLSYHVERLMSLRPIFCASHQSSRMLIFEKENFMGRSSEICDDYPSLQAMGWMMPEDTQRDSDEDCLQTPLSHRGLHQSHRLSAYDNVAPSSLSLPADTSIWTSFEISLAEPKGSEKAVILEQGKESPTEVKDSTSTLDNTASGTEDDITGTNEGLANMLTDLKQELKKQRTSYETCIQKLEESCSKYQSQVNRLEEELDQEKKKFQMLEIRHRNSERAHQDAENRNNLLQKEMEEFFKTLGDLTTGATRTT
ncbi:hypothetical protein JOQ06_023520 [Pogonophryne albipinna]|uniref:Beta/gamma crystallin 'Greek key' domain-containing protein n=1 Tax=Pogonophryne albipinna TaxID=1090488 RepID=A0AAD6FTY9_9TELE|nr:hypothetical protein JOQ06_023520 [Pogonophryne albipinna]